MPGIYSTAFEDYSFFDTNDLLFDKVGQITMILKDYGLVVRQNPPIDLLNEALELTARSKGIAQSWDDRYRLDSERFGGDSTVNIGLDGVLEHDIWCYSFVVLLDLLQELVLFYKIDFFTCEVLQRNEVDVAIIHQKIDVIIYRRKDVNLIAMPVQLLDEAESEVVYVPS